MQAIASMLSHHKIRLRYKGKPSSVSMDLNQVSSAAALAIALYSASVLLRATVGCCLQLQEIKLDPMYMQ